MRIRILQKANTSLSKASYYSFCSTGVFSYTFLNRSRGLIQSVSRKTRNILDRWANRRTRTSSADGQLYHGESTERTISPCFSSVDNTSTPTSHARSTSIQNKKTLYILFVL